jgi:hypothetical protein
MPLRCLLGLQAGLQAELQRLAQGALPALRLQCLLRLQQQRPSRLPPPPQAQEQAQAQAQALALAQALAQALAAPPPPCGARASPPCSCP